jgi:hypothetical protein
MYCVALDALNGASEVYFWEIAAEAYNNNKNGRFHKMLVDSEKFR